MAAILGSFDFVFLLLLVVDGLAVRVSDGHIHDVILLGEFDVPVVLRDKPQFPRLALKDNLSLEHHGILVEHEVDQGLLCLSVIDGMGIPGQEQAFEYPVMGVIYLR